jgi:hypothetical protein
VDSVLVLEVKSFPDKLVEVHDAKLRHAAFLHMLGQIFFAGIYFQDNCFDVLKKSRGPKDKFLNLFLCFEIIWVDEFGHHDYNFSRNIDQLFEVRDKLLHLVKSEKGLAALTS